MYLVTFFDHREYQRRPVCYDRSDPYVDVVCVWADRKLAVAEAASRRDGQVIRHDPAVWPTYHLIAH